MEQDGDGVLGKLPRSRPGTRSGKRDSGAAKPRRSPASKPRSSSASKPRTTAAKKPHAGAVKPRTAPVEQPRPEPAASTPAESGSGGDPVTDVVRTAARVAETGIKVAGGVTREVLRRLPRP